jgi:small subunit ribosomal protein S7
MSRKKSTFKRKQVIADFRYNSKTMARFINYIMKDGKKTKAEAIFYKACEILEKKTDMHPLEIFNKVIEKASPLLEVKSRRIGGSTYMSPVEPSEHRKLILAMRWLVTFSRARNEKSMEEKLAGEFIDVLNSRGATIKKKDDLFKMAESNRVFAPRKKPTEAPLINKTQGESVDVSNERRK